MSRQGVLHNVGNMENCQIGNQCKVMLDYTVFNGLIYYTNIRYNRFYFNSTYEEFLMFKEMV